MLRQTEKRGAEISLITPDPFENAAAVMQSVCRNVNGCIGPGYNFTVLPDPFNVLK